MKILKALGKVLIALGIIALICFGIFRTYLEVKRDWVIVTNAREDKAPTYKKQRWCKILGEDT